MGVDVMSPQEAVTETSSDGLPPPEGDSGRRPEPAAHAAGSRDAKPAAAVCRLDGSAASIKTARDFSAAVLADWGLAHLRDDMQLVVSELVTNAIRHATPDGGSAREPAIELSLVRHQSYVACTVADPSPKVPTPVDFDEYTESGRGLHLVECFSQAWGWTLQGGQGKIVWATFATAAPA